MTDYNRKIRDAVLKLSGRHNADHITMIVCEVDSVDLTTRSVSCTSVIDKKTFAYTAALMAEVEDGQLIIPSLGSTIIIAKPEQGNIKPFVVMYSQIDGITTITGDSSYKIETGGHTIARKGDTVGKCLDDFFTELIGAKIKTPSGDGFFSPDDISKLQKIQKRIVDLLK